MNKSNYTTNMAAWPGDGTSINIPNNNFSQILTEGITINVNPNNSYQDSDNVHNPLYEFQLLRLESDGHEDFDNQNKP